MNRNHRPEATDEIIGHAFRRSLAVILVLAALLASAMLLNRMLRKDEVIVEAPVTPPVSIRREARAPAVRFSDITREAGIAFTHSNGAGGDKLLPETMGSGAAFFDYDYDGDQDLLLVNSDDWPGEAGADRPSMKLYQNDGQGRFTDVSETSGLNLPMYGMGVAVGDIDNDGDADVFISNLGLNRLFRNEGGRFIEITAEAGVGGAADAWSTSAGFADLDNDGDLDLFVANYVRWSRQIDLEVNFQLTGIGRAYGPPNAFEGTFSYLYRNDGGGRFTDVSAPAGIQVSNPATGRPMGKALAVAPVDVDHDGWIDLLVANDTVQNFLFHNTGGGVFEERGALLGVAFDRDGKATGAMGVDSAHFRNDEDLGIAIGNFANEMTSLYATQDASTPFTRQHSVYGRGHRRGNRPGFTPRLDLRPVLFRLRSGRPPGFSAGQWPPGRRDQHRPEQPALPPARPIVLELRFRLQIKFSAPRVGKKRGPGYPTGWARRQLRRHRRRRRSRRVDHAERRPAPVVAE
jgi:hypothetical protein